MTLAETKTITKSNEFSLSRKMSEEAEYIRDVDYSPTCRICEQDAAFELSKNKFSVNDCDVLLITAFNSFSNIVNVSVFHGKHVAFEEKKMTVPYF